MKKLLVLLIVIAAALNTSAQYQNYPATPVMFPPWGSGPPLNDNTGRVLTYGYNNSPSTIKATGDTVKLYPNYWATIVQPYDSVADTVTYVVPRVPTQLYTGSTLTFIGIAGNTSSAMLRFRSGVYGAGINFKYVTAADSTLTLTKKKHYYVTFTYDGVAWIETLKAIGQ